jgi:tRNA U34 2-thiouridine synthase MnmA/TrmU
MANKHAKALVMLSGGLDSKLVVKLLEDLKVSMLGIHFNLPFGSGCCKQLCSWKFMQTEGLPMKIMDCTKGRLFKEYLNIIKKPKFGYGSGLNPCIDCRIFMLKKAASLMKKYKASFIATGEVLGERPMSQHFKAMMLVEKESGLKGRLLRPLSAKLLAETIPEKKKWVDRSKLLDIQGRSRKKQIELANHYKITYPSPGGGCLLCEKEYAKKLIDLFKNQKEISPREIELLKLGRHFRIGKSKIVVGRNLQENDALKKLAESLKAEVFECKEVVGPTTLLIGKDKESRQKAAELTAFYSDAVKEGISEVSMNKIKIRLDKINKDSLMKLRICKKG